MAINKITQTSWLKYLDIISLESTDHKSMEIPKGLEPTNKRGYKTLGNSIIYSPMSPPSLVMSTDTIWSNSEGNRQT